MELEEKVIALMQHLQIEDADEITETSYDSYEYGSEEYLVLTDEEADEKWDEELEHYLEEVILPEIPNAYHNYFDSEAWKEDTKNNGRSNTLGRYDGREYEEEVNGTTYYIYRIY